MMRLPVLYLLVLLMVPQVCHATDCTNPDNVGIVCGLSDGLTMGVCTGGACIRTYTIPGNGPRTGTGTISSSGATVTGSGTAFTSELHVGDDITAAGQTQTVYNIVSDTSLSVGGFAPVISAGSTFTYTNP